MAISNTNKTFAKNMKLRRKQLGISQEKLGELSGLHRTYIGGIEQLLRNPSIESVEKIAKALNIDVSLLTSEHYEQIINSEYALCRYKNGKYIFKPINFDEMDIKDLKILDKICN